MHKLLRRQLKKLGSFENTSLPTEEQWRQLLETVSHSYTEADQDRYTLERSLIISSEEMQTLYQRLKSSTKARMHAIANALPDLMFLLDEDGTYLEVFAAGAEGMLYRPELERKGSTVTEIFPREQAQRIMTLISSAFEHGGLQILEYELNVPSGHGWFEARAVPTGFHVDDRRTVVVLVRDITKRIKLESSSRLIKAVFDAANEGVVIMDSKRRVLMINPSFTQIARSNKDQVLGEPPAFLDAESEERSQAIWHAVERGGGWIGEISARRVDGSMFPLWLTLDAVYDDVGNITNYVALLTDVSEIKSSREELEYVATHDPLTGLINRGLFRDRLEQAVARAIRSGQSGAVLFLDLDRFKMINDNLGHHVGDSLLTQVSQRLKSECRREDTLARFGGDEFTFILEDLNHQQDAAIIADKMLDALLWPFQLDSYEFGISASIGISIFPQDGEDVDLLVRQADIAMYAAKESGRNRFHIFTKELTDTAFKRFALEVDLRPAVAAGQLFLEYQPQYRLDSGQLIGLEALVRWEHPEKGLIPPGDFIPVAEVTGLIDNIWEWVLRATCRQIRAWDAKGLPPILVAVNLSRRQLMNPWLDRSIAHILHEEGVSGERLELEITESAILDQAEIAYRNLKTLHEMGLTLAIDDFGTGYSSMENLKRFPLDRLKIDRTFIRDLGSDPNDEAIVRATIALGNSLQLRLIAEGVETEQQREFLLAEGCHEVQGYLFSRPVGAAEVEVLLSGSS